MQGFSHYESPHFALLKSAATKALSDQAAKSRKGGYVDSDHDIIKAIDKYGAYAKQGKTPPEPSESAIDASDPEVGAYLAYLHHKKVHAKIDGHSSIEADLDKQMARFTYGNPLWQQMLVEYFETYWQYPYHIGEAPDYRSWKDKNFGDNDLNYGVIDWRLPWDATIAFIGDIGTGTDEAAAVLLAAMSFKPDAILHLGDVYFSGTEFEINQRYVGLFREVFQDKGRRVPVFGVPGNHEYFTAAKPYLAMLDSEALTIHPDKRQRASYFSLRTEDDGWQFQGLDTGYHGHYMDVSVNIQKTILTYIHNGQVGKPQKSPAEWPQGINPHFNKAGGAHLAVKDESEHPSMVTLRPDELEWHAHHIKAFKGRSVLLSHHQLYSSNQTCGPAQKMLDGKPDPEDLARQGVNIGLWRQFGPYFDTDVAAWLWGHEHNLAIYKKYYRPMGWPEPEGDDDLMKTLPLGRCAGHAAIPVALKEQPYKMNNPIPFVGENCQLGVTSGWYNRGFEVLKLNGKGNPADLRYFQVNGADPEPHEIYTEQIL